MRNKKQIFNVLTSSFLLLCMLVVITPKELWHHHEHKLSHHESDNQQEEDCAVCHFTFSGFIQNQLQVDEPIQVFETLLTAVAYQFVSATLLITHSGLAPPHLN